MSNITYYEANRLLDDSMTTVYLAPYSGSPGRSGSGGTALVMDRKQAVFDASVNGVTQNNGAVEFDEATSDLGTADYIAAFDAATDGNMKWYAPLISPQTSIGGATSQFDITKTGHIVRYTWDGTGTDPGITASLPNEGDWVIINAQNFNAANNGTFRVINSDTNYFEVINEDGVAESNKTIGTGTLKYQTPLSRAMTSGTVLRIADGEFIVRIQ